MELIAELETEPRGVYCGAIGHISPKREAFFIVVIRSPVVFRDATYEMGIGSGVVFDLEGAKEYAECLLKMKFLTDPPKPFELIETMLYEPGSGFWLLDRHLRGSNPGALFRLRLRRRSRHLLPTREIAGKEHERLRAGDARRDGGADRHLGPAARQRPDEYDLRFGTAQGSSADPFLFHKTTRRELYDGEWKHYNETLGADEVLYLNERGELAEGSRTTIFIERDGRL